MPILLLSLVYPLLLAAAAAGGAALPDTPIGGHVHAFLAAYAAGDSASIDAFARAHLAPAALARTPMAERVRRIRDSRAEHGALTLLAVTRDESATLGVRMLDEHGEKVDLEFMGEPAPPNLLTGVRWEIGGPGAGPAAGPAPAAGPPLPEAKAIAAIEDEVARRAREQDFSGVVLVARGDRPLVELPYGLADRARKTKVVLDTRFNFASIGKAFTKAAIAQLAQAGKLSLSDPVTKYLPQYRVANADRVTLAQLVDHRGGVDDVLRYVDSGAVAHRLVDVAAWLELIRDKPLLFEPGSAQRYSNGGYVLLGAVIEKVSGEDFYDYVRRHVTGPVGMTGTAWDRQHDASPARAVGYTRRASGAPGGGHAAPDPSAPRRPVTDEWPERGSPAGGGYTSAPDLWRFAEALRNRRLASGAWTAWLLGDPAPGSGAVVDTTFADAGYGIAGGSPGTNGVLELAGPYDVVVLTNDDPPGAEDLARAIRGILARVER